MVTLDLLSGKEILLDKRELEVELDPRYVNVTGDTMTGDLSVTSGGFLVSHPTSGTNVVIKENTYSYNNVGGKGDRDGFIISTDSGNVWYTASMGGFRIVDGDYSNYQYYKNGQAISDSLWFKFDFGSGNSPVITECRIHANVASQSGVWKWQGSNNDTDWTDIGSSFTLGTNNPDVHTQLNGNTTGYRYYRLLGVSGTMSWGALVYEWEFKIDNSLGGKAVVDFPDLVGFGVSDPEAQMDIKAISSQAGDWVQRVKSVNDVQFMGVRNDGKVAYGVRNDTPTYPVDVAGEFLSTGVMFIDPLATLTNATVTNIGTPGSTTYTYKVIPMVGGRRGASSVFTTTTGNATLNQNNYNRISFAHIKGATSYELRRLSGGSSTGWIYTGYPTMEGDLYIDDKGATGDGTDNNYLTNFGTGWLALGGTKGAYVTYSPIAQLQTTNSVVNLTGTHTNNEFVFLSASYYGTFTLDNTYLPNWTRIGGIFMGGSPSGGSGRNGIGVLAIGRGGYIGGTGVYAVGEAVNNNPAYGVRTVATSYTGQNGYGLYVDSGSGAGTNYAIYTNSGLNVLNDQLKVDGSGDKTQLIVQGHSTQTSNLQEWQNSSGTLLVSIKGDGTTYLLDVGLQLATASASETKAVSFAPSGYTAMNIYNRAGSLTIGTSTGTTNRIMNMSLVSSSGSISVYGASAEFFPADTGGTAKIGRTGNRWDIYGSTADFSGSVVFNDSGSATSDVRAEGDTDTNLLFVDASADKVGVGTNTPAEKLDVNGTVRATGYNISGNAGVSGTFTTADAKTVTVTNGLITAIV